MTFKQLSTIVNKKISYGIVQPGESVPNGIPVIKVFNLISGLKSIDELDTTNQENADKYARTKLNGGELIVSVVGTVGKTAIVPKKFAGCNLVRATALIDIPEPVTALWVKYYIDSPNGQLYINTNLNTTVQPTLNIKSLAEMPIPFFESRYIEKAVSILSNIDDKIELNNRINKNLEKQAGAIFNDMFPNIAIGTHTIGEYITLKRGKNLIIKNAVFGDVPVVAGGLKPATYHNKANTTAPVLTISASGANAGYVNLWHIPVWSSDSSFIDSTMTENVYFWYVMLKKRQKEIFDSQTGSAQPHIYPQHIEILPVFELDKKYILEFNDIVKPLFNRIGENKQENKFLSALRDALLPKLMNGEIDVSAVRI